MTIIAIVAGCIGVILAIFCTIMIIHPDRFKEKWGSTAEEWKTAGKVGVVGAIIIVCIGIYIGTTNGGMNNHRYSYDSTYDEYGSGAPYDKDDKYYSDNDHNKDGKINDQEFQDALGDYMDDVMGY